MTRKHLFVGGAVLAAVVAGTGLGIAAYQLLGDPSGEATGAGGRPVFQAELGGPYTLVDTGGAPVTEADYAGDYTLYYFGFTFCPDICPTELQVIAAAYDQLAPEIREQLRMVFVTVDPGRDTVEAMADYVSLFHPELEGLTGTQEQTDAAAAAFGVYYQPVGKDEDPEYYLVDHSTFTYLQGPDNENALVFPYGMAPDQMAAQIRQVIDG